MFFKLKPSKTKSNTSIRKNISLKKLWSGRVESIFAIESGYVMIIEYSRKAYMCKNTLNCLVYVRLVCHTSLITNICQSLEIFNQYIDTEYSLPIMYSVGIKW